MSKVKPNLIQTALSLLTKYRVEILFSFVLSAILILGYLLYNHDTIDISFGKRVVLSYMPSALAVWTISFLGLTYIAKHARIKTKMTAKKIHLLASYSNKRVWITVALAIFACYLPVILLGHATLSPDSWSSVAQSTGEAPLSNAHPVIFTLFVSVPIHIGTAIKDIELGTLFYSIIQSALLAAIFARVILMIRNEGGSKAAIAATFIFYAILPINSIAGIIMWKDILFAGFGLLFLMLLRKLYLENNTFFTKRNISLFIIFAFLFCTWRNNGIYAYILFLTIVTLFNYKTFFSKRTLLLFSPIPLFIIYSITSAAISTPTSLAESMSVPLQQIARTVKYHDQSISEEDKRIIGEILPYDKLSILYNPSLSDPVKSTLNVAAFNDNQPRYVGLWLRLLVDYSKTYILSTLYNTYGYFYPYYTSPTTTDIVPNNATPYNAPRDYVDTAYSNGGKQAVERNQALLTSILPALRNIGFYCFTILVLLYIAIIKKKKELAGVFIILLSILLTTILGPVNGEFRYLYIFVVATPFIIASLYLRTNIKQTGDRG